MVYGYTALVDKPAILHCISSAGVEAMFELVPRLAGLFVGNQPGQVNIPWEDRIRLQPCTYIWRKNTTSAYGDSDDYLVSIHIDCTLADSALSMAYAVARIIDSCVFLYDEEHTPIATHFSYAFTVHGAYAELRLSRAAARMYDDLANTGSRDILGNPMVIERMQGSRRGRSTVTESDVMNILYLLDQLNGMPINPADVVMPIYVQL